MSNEWVTNDERRSDSYSVTTEELLVNRPGDYCIRYWVTNDEQPGALKWQLLSNYWGVTGKQTRGYCINESFCEIANWPIDYESNWIFLGFHN